MADTTSSIELGFIGFGNMAQAMAQGLVSSGALEGAHIHACAAHFDRLRARIVPYPLHIGHPFTQVSYDASRHHPL